MFGETPEGIRQTNQVLLNEEVATLTNSFEQ
jgi:hypothetical protein